MQSRSVQERPTTVGHTSLNFLQFLTLQFYKDFHKGAAISRAYSIVVRARESWSPQILYTKVSCTSYQLSRDQPSENHQTTLLLKFSHSTLKVASVFATSGSQPGLGYGWVAGWKSAWQTPCNTRRWHLGAPTHGHQIEVRYHTLFDSFFHSPS